MFEALIPFWKMGISSLKQIEACSCYGWKYLPGNVAKMVVECRETFRERSSDIPPLFLSPPHTRYISNMGFRGLHPVYPPPFLLVNWGKGCGANSDYHKHTIKMRGHPRGIPKLRDGRWGRGGRLEGLPIRLGPRPSRFPLDQKKKRSREREKLSCWRCT